MLLLDEPLAGLSREERASIKQLIASIPRETTVVMIEHDMDTALDLADRITVLHYGARHRRGHARRGGRRPEDARGLPWPLRRSPWMRSTRSTAKAMYCTESRSTLVEGKVMALLGRNGAGKTTCMNSIIGWLPPRRGRVRLFGEPIERLSPEAISRKGVGLVPQGRRMFPTLTVKENLVVAGRGERVDSRRASSTFSRG